MKSKLKLLDLAVSVLSMLYGAWLVATSWPDPTWWAVMLLVGGMIAIPLSILNPLGRLQTRYVRKMVKKA